MQKREVGESCSILLEKVLPANRASLSSFKHQSVISTCSKENKLLASSGKAFQSLDSTRSASPDISFIDEKSFREILTPCPSKKRKVTSTKHGVSRDEQNHSGHLNNVRSCKSDGCSSLPNSLDCDIICQESDNKLVQSAQSSVSDLRQDNRTANTETANQKNKSQSSSMPSSAVESKGSEFLIQVPCYVIYRSNYLSVRILDIGG